MLVNTRTVRIEWGDCDPAGIVYYPRYLAFFDACTSALIERGWSSGSLRARSGAHESIEDWTSRTSGARSACRLHR